LLISAAALGGAAEAQYYAYPPGYRGPPPGPAYGYGPPPPGGVQPGPPSRILPYPEEQADAALPAPAFVPPGNGQQIPSGYGHQLDQNQPPRADGPDVIRPPGAIGAAPQQATPQPGAPAATSALPPEDQPEQGTPKELSPELKRQLVNYQTKEPAGTIIVDTPHTFLYLVLGNGKALRYGIGVGREGFTWNGTERVSRMKEWPDWYPPAEMIERQPYLPRMMAGGEGNPLGARALYLGNTLYRIHGTNQPSTIGTFVSSGCIRLLNSDIEDLYSRVQVGTRVVVLPGGKPPEVASSAAAASASAQAQPGAPAQGAGSITSSALPPVRR
jgi:lipoprotein-anchoring transpeptidase ErfK/SrfK